MILGSLTALGLGSLGFLRGGFWKTVQLYLSGRSAVVQERERRATLVALTHAVRPGVSVQDYRTGDVATIVQCTPSGVPTVMLAVIGVDDVERSEDACCPAADAVHGEADQVPGARRHGAVADPPPVAPK